MSCCIGVFTKLKLASPVSKASMLALAVSEEVMLALVMLRCVPNGAMLLGGSDLGRLSVQGVRSFGSERNHFFFLPSF